MSVRREALSVDGVAARSEKVIFTDGVTVFREELDSGWYYTSGSDNVKHGKVHGLWLRASITRPDGETVSREYSLPDSIPNGKSWTTKTVNVGMNR